MEDDRELENELVLIALRGMIDTNKIRIITGFISEVDMDLGEGVGCVRRGDLVAILQKAGGVHFHTFVLPTGEEA